MKQYKFYPKVIKMKYASLVKKLLSEGYDNYILIYKELVAGDNMEMVNFFQN
jgi:hypothetical protein